MPLLPPHLIDDELEILREAKLAKKKGKVGLQGPSKYGAGGRRVAKTKGRRK